MPLEIECSITPRPYQSESIYAALESLKTYRSTLIVLPTGCHARGQRILMADGSFRNVEDIEVGDRVMGLASQPRTVLKLNRGTDDLYEIVPTKGDSWFVNGDHILTLVSTRQKRRGQFPSQRGGQLVDVSVRDWLKWSKWKKHVHKLFRAPVDRFDRVADHLPVDPYFLGLILGDGALAHQNICVYTVDDEIVQECSRQAHGFDLDLRVVDSDRCPGYRFCEKTKSGRRGGGNPLLNALRELGLTPIACEDRFVPHAYLVADFRSRLEILAGLIDSDGHLSGSCFDWVSKSWTLANNFAFLARSVGLAAYLKPKTVDGVTYFRVSVSGHTDKIPCRIPRKKAPPRRQTKNALRTGFSVRPIGRGEFFGFTLDGDGRYLLDDFTVTHNCGKTIVFSLLTRLGIDRGRRVLILVDRDELVKQAVRRLRQDVGVRADVEKASLRADIDAQVVVASIQTLSRTKRLERWSPEAFDLVVCDEAHHAVANGWKRVVDYFSSAKVVGVTATPDRRDCKSLLEVFEDVAYEMTVREAIDGGWLVPIRQLFVRVDGLDLSEVRRAAKDLNQGDLEAVVRNADILERMAHPTMKLVGNKQAIVFCVSVAHAEAFVEYLLKHGKTAALVEANTPSAKREAYIEAFRDGDVQYLANVGVLCEGFDAPSVEAVVMLRTTMSRGLYSQQIGRGTRPLPGIVDELNGAELRRAAIAASTKSEVLVLDFVGNSGKHKLVHAIEALEPDADPEVIRKAERLIEQQSLDVGVALDMAKKLVEEARRRPSSTDGQSLLEFDSEEVDPFDETAPGKTLKLFGRRRIKDPWQRKVTKPQVQALERLGVPDAQILNRKEASALLDELIPRAKSKLATPGQVDQLILSGMDRSDALRLSYDDARHRLFSERSATDNQRHVLQRYGYSPEELADMNMAQASKAIDEIRDNGWRRPA